MPQTTLHLVAGLTAMIIAATAWLGDRRRMRRSDPDAVGLVPWTGLFFWALLATCVLLGLGVREWFGG